MPRTALKKIVEKPLIKSGKPTSKVNKEKLSKNAIGNLMVVDREKYILLKDVYRKYHSKKSAKSPPSDKKKEKTISEKLIVPKPIVEDVLEETPTITPLVLPSSMVPSAPPSRIVRGGCNF